ncbi:sugar phosphate isomerase/epimerase [Leuconostoc gelidum]|uniref:sugar phosphate isomerase/epimerase n=1 Tax=Leuconostoc gelidum TaxID=1244 RepID=UPI001C7D430C|nr:sugar phosphate isomerase/epimerase [Leuconostoc gelidum]MBZ6009999.1 epimerase [Leuconostoc gelidum subsp. aenigmaticum]
MNRQNIVLNTLLLKNEFEKGRSQSQLVNDLINQLSVSNIEIRREFNADTFSELVAIRKIYLEQNTDFFYSVPDNLFLNKHLNPKLFQYVGESQFMGVKHLKMTLGDWHSSMFKELSYLSKILPANIELNIENDQTRANSDIELLNDFFETANQNNINIGFVNDIGNWIFTDQDVYNCSLSLSRYTRFVHLKNYKKIQDSVDTTPFYDGEINWEKIIKLFSDDLPIALEYPSTMENILNDINAFKTSKV